MKSFSHFNAVSITEVESILGKYGDKASIIAGGTDLLGKMKDSIMPVYPEALINIKSIPGLKYIKETNGILEIGSLTTLNEIAENSIVKTQCNALALAAFRTAMPNLRNMGTIGGNICQDIRCWYYRTQLNRFPCLRKGGGRCYALEGDNRYHSIFGGSVEAGCIAVHPSDTAPALIALDAKIVTNKRTINADNFFEVKPMSTTVLAKDEIVTAIQIPKSGKDVVSSFIKFAMRKSIDFPIVNCASRLSMDGNKISNARICLNAVYVVPYRAIKAEQLLEGKVLSEAIAEEAADASVEGAKPLKHNKYMIQIARTLVKRSILECGSASGK